VETQGQVVYYDGELASYLMFHSSSGGRTENSEEVFPYMVPYLRSVKSPYEDDATHKQETKTVSVDTFVKAVNGLNRKHITETDVQKMEITARTTGGRVKTIQIGNNEFTGSEIRDLFGLASANFTYNIEDYHVIFTTTGFGHGVGMSQYGANGMAKKGYNYKQILKHYYTGIDMGQVTDEIIEKSNNTTGPSEDDEDAVKDINEKTGKATEKTSDKSDDSKKKESND
jgi:stage II sporulation protein D